jgi:hypothetical protein
MPSNFLWAVGTQRNVLTTELNSLANNALVLGSAIDISTGASDLGKLYADIELLVTFSAAPTANTSILVWILRTLDGTNYEDGSTSVQPLRLFDASFPLRATTAAQRITKRIQLPPGNNFKFLLKNDASGQAFAASGNILSIRPVTEQY